MKTCLVQKGMICGVILLFVGAGFAEANTAGRLNKLMNRDVVEVVDQQQTGNCGYGWNVYDPIWLAQGFTPTLPMLTKVELSLFLAGSPPDNVQITVSIRDSLYGNDLTSATIDGTEVSSVATWIEFNFSDIEVTPGHTYYILCRANGGSQGNCYCWVFADNNPYTGGDAWGSDMGYYWFLMDSQDHPLTDCCFKTYGLEEQPSTPEIAGPTSGNVGQSYNFTFLSTDPDGNILYYYVDWGDGQTAAWVGPYTSGQLVTISHVWSKRGTYTVKAKVKDFYAAESDMALLKIKMPVSYNIPIPSALERVLERFPNAFPILRYVLDLKNMKLLIIGVVI
jgi:hypothetical protein